MRAFRELLSRSVSALRKNRRWLILIAWILPAAYLYNIVDRMEAAPDPPMMPADTLNLRFGIDVYVRREIFHEIARHERRWRRSAEGAFPNDVWSQYDDYARILSSHIHWLAKRRDLHYSQVFMVYDEGIREAWSAPGREPLEAAWVPLRPRTR